jgi:hypothetical protein
LSNNEAFHRITAARLARKFPVIFELLERRDVHLTAVCLLRDYLTPENHLELLQDVSHKTKLEIEELLARRFPRPDVASGLSRLPDRGPRAFEPLSEGRYRLQLNASARLKEKLELARDLMSHANPSGDLAVVVERALDILIERLEARRFAQTKCPSAKKGITSEAQPPEAQPSESQSPKAQSLGAKPFETEALGARRFAQTKCRPVRKKAAAATALEVINRCSKRSPTKWSSSRWLGSTPSRMKVRSAKPGDSRWIRSTRRPTKPSRTRPSRTGRSLRRTRRAEVDRAARQQQEVAQTRQAAHTSSMRCVAESSLAMVTVVRS